MNLTTQLKEAQALIADLQNKADAAQAVADELAAVKASLTDAANQLNAAQDEINDLKGQVEDLCAEKATLTAELEEMVAEQKSADEAAREIVAGLGMQETPQVSVEPVAKTRDEVIAEYLTLTGAAQGKFYQENKAVILGRE